MNEYKWVSECSLIPVLSLPLLNSSYPFTIVFASSPSSSLPLHPLPLYSPTSSSPSPFSALPIPRFSSSPWLRYLTHGQKEASTEETVVLLNVSEKTSGLFKCEVMGEGPSFRTAVRTKMMTVAGEWRNGCVTCESPWRLWKAEDCER